MQFLKDWVKQDGIFGVTLWCLLILFALLNVLASIGGLLHGTE